MSRILLRGGINSESSAAPTALLFVGAAVNLTVQQCIKTHYFSWGLIAALNVEASY